ncbi:proline rich transmembrane protein 1B [Hypomesus transpacificus]|uniref:proline rich transmembrane protein 1B n=1 Tax=Hypomesus transpacificus TaxID=137520 RepID=UPI001F087455|nr:proline rich transmembrane protein 1B [Hypomesus transpacificus]
MATGIPESSNSEGTQGLQNLTRQTQSPVQNVQPELNSDYPLSLDYSTNNKPTIHPLCDTDRLQADSSGFCVDSEGRLSRGEQPIQTNQEVMTSPVGCPSEISLFQPSFDVTIPSEEPPPYSPPDPKMAYLFYPSQPPHHPGPAVIACQPGPNQPAFYHSQFNPLPNYPPYTIYMNGSSLGEENVPLPKDYMVESLLVTIFCCLMSGIMALMYSYETRAALARGDVREAERTSQKARLLVLFSLMFGVCVCVGWVIYIVIVLCA